MFRATKLNSIPIFLFAVAWVTNTAAQIIERDDQLTNKEKDDCQIIIDKHSRNETLTPAEGDALVNCFFPQDFNDGGPGPGFAAYRRGDARSLYDIQDFADVPGIIGDAW